MAVGIDVKAWDGLLRKAVEDILDTHGGLAALFPLLCFITIWIVWHFCNRIIKAKQDEMNRMAKEKERLEDIVLTTRLSTRKKGR